MNRVVLLSNLLAWSLVACQPLFYLVALSSAQRALSAPAYIELRQRINPLMMRRLPGLYGLALLTTPALLALAWSDGEQVVAITAAIGLLCLVLDLVLMLRVSVPINRRMDGWSIASHPADWSADRSKWFTIFGYRQVVLLTGFAGALAGAAFARW